MVRKVICLLALVLVLGGCSPGLIKQGSELEMESIQEKLGEYYDVLYQQHNIEVMESYLTEEGRFYLGIRKLYSFGEEISTEELDRMKATIFELIGVEFPLDIYQCCLQEEADIRGEITSLDQEQKRILIVNQDNLIGQTADAVWVSLTEDATIQHVESNQELTFADLEVSQQVAAWSVGIFLESYPSQTSVIRIDVLN